MNKRFFNQQNLTRRLRMLFVLFAMLLLPLGAWAQTITVAGHSPAEGGAIEGDGITGTVSFTASTNTLTLNGATITGSIVKTANEAGDQLIINLVGTNTVNGQILFQDRTLPGDLTFTGNGLLNIASNVANGVIDGVSSVNTGEGLYIATDSPDPQCYNGYYINGTNADDNSVKSLTVSTSVTYPIWVYNTSTTHYTQLTEAAPTFTTPSANVDENHDGSVSYSGNTLTLDNFLCKTTENSEFVFFVGKSLQNLIVNLVGESSIFGSGFHYTGNAELTFTTSNNGKLTYTGEPSYWSNYVTVNYENGLGYYGNVISTDWPRLQIGGTFVRGTTNTVGSYSNVSFDDTTNTLTLGGVTIGSQNSTVTDIDVYIKDLKVEISGTNTVYGRFFGMYEENGRRAGTITFKKKSGAGTAELTVSGYGEGGPVHNFVSSTLGEGLYISGKGTDSENEPVSIPTLSYYNGDYNDFDNPSNTVKEVTISENEPGTKLWIGGTAVTSEGDVFGDGKVSYNNHILSLNGATIEDIVSNVGTLTIDLTGSNNIRSISTTGNATALAFTGDGTLTLENSDGIISNFSSVDTGDFNLLSNSTPGIHWNATSNKFMDFANFDIATELTLTKAKVYQLWVGGVQVTDDNKDGITGVTYTVGQGSYQSISGTVSFNPTGNILTLTGASIGSPFSYCEAPIISNLPNLEININKIDLYGGCQLQGYQNGFIDDGSGCAKSLNTDATLVFSTNYTSSSEAESPTMQIDCYDPIASGFKSIGTSNQIIYKRTSNYYWVQRIAQPTMSLVNGSLQLSDNNEVDLNYESNSAVTLKYKITDASGTTGEEKTFVETTVETINNPCTIEAWAEYQGQESGHIKGKYFGPAENPMRLVYGADPVDFVLAPAIEEGDGIIINGIEASVSYSSTTGKVSSETLGSHGAVVSLGYQDETIQTTLLNNSFDMNFDVVPPAPTIGLAEGAYPSTHEAITVTSDGLANTTIKYKWDDDDEADYPATGVPFQAGTLKAWVVYTNGGTSLSSDIVSATYTLLQDPGLDFVVGDNPVEEVNYTIGGSSNPTLPTLQKPEGVTVTYASSNKGVATVATDGTVTPVGVGYTTITATSTATSEYEAGEASYTLNVYKDLSHSSITVEVANVTYNGQAKTPTVTVKDGDKVLMYGEDNGDGTLLYEYKVEYANNTNAGLATAETGAPTATITALTDGSVSHMEVNWYRGSTTKTFTINKAQLTVKADDKTYNVGDDIELTVSYDGFVNGETETVLTTQPSASYGTADVTKPGSYEITASGGVAQNYDFIYETGTLTINRQLNVSFSTSNEWATYYGSENLATPKGLKAYQVTAVEGATVTISEIGYIPANTAVLLKNVSNNNTWSNIAASAYTEATSTFASNKLIGTASDVDVSTISGGTVYVLYNNMFKRATGGTIPANRGYLVVEPSAVNAGNAPQLSITIGDENTTAISNTDFTDNTDKAGEWYSIDGVKLNGQPQKPGLYIKNGKKVFINKK